MRRLTIAAMMLSALALGGCGSDDDKSLYDAPKPLDKMSNEEWCAFYAKFITDPHIAPKTKAEDIARMRARGCPMAG